MKAVVLAAGQGTRLRPMAGGQPKPLFRLLGLTLLERTVLSLREAGCREIVVVTGFASERIRSRLGGRVGDGIHWVFAESWRRGNGGSLLAAAPLVRGEPFLLAMADHVADPDVFRFAVEAARTRGPSLARGDVFLVVDGRLGGVHDLDEATRVRREGDRIVAIGKGLEPFDGVDTGLFIASDGLFQALEGIAAVPEAAAAPKRAARADDRAGREGSFRLAAARGMEPVVVPPLSAEEREGGAQSEDLSLSAALGRLARRGRLFALLLDRGWWIDVDDARAARAAARRLLQSAGASGGDGPISRWLNRPVSRRITSVLARIGATPNAVTWSAFAVALSAAAAFGTGHPVLGGLLVQASSILDGADGELARVRMMRQPAGAFLDTVLDRYADAAVVGGLAAAIAVAGDAGPLFTASPSLAWWVALAALAGMPLSAMMKDRLLLLGRARPGRRYNPLEDDPAWLRWLPANRDGRCFITFACGILSAPWAALVLLAVLTHALALGRLVSGHRRLREGAGASADGRVAPAGARVDAAADERANVGADACVGAHPRARASSAAAPDSRQ